MKKITIEETKKTAIHLLKQTIEYLETGNGSNKPICNNCDALTLIEKALSINH